MIETEVKLLKTPLGNIDYLRITFKYNKRTSTFIFNETEFIDFYAKIEIVNEQRLNIKMEKERDNVP